MQAREAQLLGIASLPQTDITATISTPDDQ